jgi:putative transcriptional regulator
MNQKELADKVNVSRRTISSLENGHYNPSLDLAFRITKVLGRDSIEDVFIMYD